MSGFELVWHQFRFDQKTFWREPASVFFTVALPLIFLFLFASIFGNGEVEVDGRVIRGTTYFIPGIVALSLVSATMVNLAIALTIARERGELKRLRSTPLPPWAYIAGRVLTAIEVTFIMVVLVVAIGRLIYGVTVPTGTLPGVLLTLIVASASFCALGFALSTLIPSEAAAPAITQAIVLPLYFISGLFISVELIPRVMRWVASVFPVKHLFDALLDAFNPATSGPGIAWDHLGVLALWGLVGFLIAARGFRWAPRGS